MMAAAASAASAGKNFVRSALRRSQGSALAFCGATRRGSALTFGALRTLSSLPSAAPAAPTAAPATAPPLSERDFHAAADAQLARIEQALAPLEEALGDELDLSCAMGVLTLRLGAARGTYVLNKQTPNRQLWWSSPLSGPRRFALDARRGAWLSARGDGAELAAELRRELKKLTGVELEGLAPPPPPERQ